MVDSELVPSDANLGLSEPQRAAAASPLTPDFIEGEFRELPPRRVRDHLRVLYKHRRLAAGCFAGCMVLTVLVTLMTTRTYTATAQIQVARSSPIKLQLKDNVLDLDETERILNGTSSFLATQVQALRSRDVAERAIREFHLAENAAFTESAQGATALAAVPVSLPAFLQPRGLTDAGSDANLPDTATAAPPDGPVDPALLDRYLGYLAVEDVRGTDLIEVRFTAPSPSLAALLTAAHIQAYLGAVKESQITTDSTAKVFLAQQLDESRTRAERAGEGLADFAAQHPDVAVNQEDRLIGKQIKLMSVQVSDAEGRRAAAQSRFEFLTKAKREPLQHFLDDSDAIKKLRLALLDIQAQQASLKERLGPNHSQMRELRGQETELRLQLDNEVQQEVAAAQARFKAAKMQEDQLRTRLAQLEQRATVMRSLGEQYEFLKTERENATALHESLLKQQTDTTVHSELATSNVRVIQRPEVPRFAAWPRKKMNLMVGALAGLALAIGAAFFRESLDSSLKSSEEAEGHLQLPTLATIPNYALARRPVGRVRLLPSWRSGEAQRGNGAGDDRQQLVVVNDPWSPVAETFRILRTALLFSSATAPPQVILVTSAAAGEGKTVTAVNLACTLAEGGRRVLLVDVDLRHPGCHEVLGVGLTPGLSSYLSGRAELAVLARAAAAPRIDFLPAGAPPANPAELVGSERMRTALATLRAEYDVIVLDSPPVLPVTDTVLLAREADAVLLVMKGQAAPREVVRRARDQLALAGARLAGVVVNNVTRAWGDYPLYDSYPHYRGARPAGATGPDLRAGKA